MSAIDNSKPVIYEGAKPELSANGKFILMIVGDNAHHIVPVDSIELIDCAGADTRPIICRNGNIYKIDITNDRAYARWIDFSLKLLSRV